MSFVKGQVVKVLPLTNEEIKEKIGAFNQPYINNVRKLSGYVAIYKGNPATSQGQQYGKYEFLGAGKAIQKASYQNYIHDFFFAINDPEPPPVIKSVVIRHGKIEEEL